MTTTIGRLGGAVARMLGRTRPLELSVTAAGPRGDLELPSTGDGVWELVAVQGRHCLAPSQASHYLYVVLPEAFRARARGGIWVEAEYHGDAYGRFRLQYASRNREAPESGLYATAEQRWDGEAAGIKTFRKALFPLPEFDPERTQNHGASFRLEFREELLLAGLRVFLEPPPAAEGYRLTAPLPELKKLPGRFYPINYLFIEITNACNFKCTWCPDEIMDRRRGFMKKEKVIRILDEVAAKKAWLGPLYPVKLHQMGEPFLHPDLVEIVAHAEALGVGIELNTNCGLITEENLDGLYRAGLTNLILSYQTPDGESFKTRKAPRIGFDAYRDKVRLAVERKLATGARTQLEIDIMNTKYADGFRIVSADEQALGFLEDWIGFCQGLERKYGLAPRVHDWETIQSRNFLDADENGSRYTLLDGVHLIWKRCHTWGNVIGGHETVEVESSYCPAPYEQLVIQWNGDVTTCCTDYEGRTKTANVFAESIESIWTGRTLTERKRDMLAGRLLDVCARCQGFK